MPISGEGIYGIPLKTVQAGVTAHVGGGQASAFQIVADIVEIATCASGGDSVKLPLATPGLQILILNHGAASANVFPASGQYIDEGSANGHKACGINASLLCSCYATTKWESQTLAR